MNIKSKGDRMFGIINGMFMLLICFITVYPVWYCFIIAFNDGTDAMMGNIYWFPRVFTFDNFKSVFSDSSIITAFGVTILRTITATAAHVLFTAIVAYAYSKKYLVGRKLYLTLGTITLFFGGGLIPTFLVIKALGLYNNFLVYILLPMFSFYDAILFMNFFNSLPESIEESAKIDGAGDLLIFLKIIVPVSIPIFATITLFNGVFNWNDYFIAIMYTSSERLQPIQTFLYRIIAQSSSEKMAMSASAAGVNSVTSNSIKMATMVVTTVPIMCVYPFLQKYFVKGIMVGSVKG